MKYAVGIDIGGTKINFALLKNWHLVKRRKVFTPKNKKELIRVIGGNIKELITNISRTEVVGIGIGVPSCLNEKRDLILSPPNLKVLKNCRLAKIIEKKLGIRTIMENDANCFTLSEAIIGAGKNYKSVLGITLGTGVGGGIVFKKRKNYRIYRGAFGRAGEVGRMVIKFDGFRCSYGYGTFGCFEQYASEKFIKKKTKISPIELERRAKRGDKKAKSIYEKFGRNLGIGLANLINILDPEVIIIGGGLSKAGSLILNPARREIRKRVFLVKYKKFAKIKKAKLGDFAGAIGAALLLKYNNEKN